MNKLKLTLGFLPALHGHKVCAAEGASPQAKGRVGPQASGRHSNCRILARLVKNNSKPAIAKLLINIITITIRNHI